MRFFIIADEHIGSDNNEGFFMQTKYTEQTLQIFQALEQAVQEQGADFIISAGDLISFGTVEEMQQAAAFCSLFSVPFYHALGNHDCMQPDFQKLWLQNAPSLFPGGTIEQTFVYGGIRFDLLTNYWGKDFPYYVMGPKDWTRLDEAQFERLRSGDQGLPRIIVCHSQIRPAYPAQTGMQDLQHVPCNGFDEVGSYLIREFHPLMIIGGHNHMNVLEKIDLTYAVTVAALSEAPFEYKIVDFTDGVLSMKTASLANRVHFKFEYDEASRFVQGRSQDRDF